MIRLEVTEGTRCIHFSYELAETIPAFSGGGGGVPEN